MPQRNPFVYGEVVPKSAFVGRRAELDRLTAHIAQARTLLAEARADNPVGRKFDFLCQEFNREANTTCSKANDIDTTRAGLALKAVIEQMRESFTLSEFSIEPGFDEPGILQALTRSMEEMAREREYRYARAAPLDNSEPKLAMFRSLGYQAVDYYLWAFTGELTGGALAGEVALRPLNPKDGLEQRIAILREELAASQVTTQDMIEASLFPQRPSTFPSYSVDLTVADGEGGGEGQSIGYLSLRPNERQDGVLSIAISLQPAYWGAPPEAQAVLGAVYEHAGDQPAPVRVMISTTAHADRSEALFSGLGLTRGVDDRPILYKDLQPARP